ALAPTASTGGGDVLFNAGPVARGGVPALSGGLVTGASAPSSTSGSLLENDYLRVEPDRGGLIRRVLDKANDREVLPPGGVANLLQLHPDHPVKWDAWDLDRSYRAKVTDLADGAVTVAGDAV